MRRVLLVLLLVLLYLCLVPRVLLTPGVIGPVTSYINSVNPAVPAVDIAEVLIQVAEEQSIPLYLLVAIAEVESLFDHSRVGTSGEQGIMQLHPRYHEVIDNLYLHVSYAANYLKSLLAVYPEPYAIAAYNQGSSRANPTSWYVRKVSLARQTADDKLQFTDD